MKKTTVNSAIVAKSIEKKAAPILRKLPDEKISTQEQFDNAAQYLKQLKELDKMAMEEEEKITIPLQSALKAARAHFKPFHNLVADTQRYIKSNMETFLLWKQQQRGKLTADLESGKIKKVSTFMAKSAELETQSSAATERTIQELICTNVKKTPLEYMVADTAAIRAALKDGKKVPGWELRDKISIAI